MKLISSADRNYVTSFEELPFAGFAKLHWVELDLGQWETGKPLRLIVPLLPGRSEVGEAPAA